MGHKGVDKRGRYGNEVGNSLRNKRERERDKPIGEEGAVSLKKLIRRCQGLAEG